MQLNCIAASDAFVWCANEHGHAYYAEHAGVPSRTEWARVPGRLEVTKHTISYMDASEVSAAAWHTAVPLLTDTT